MSTVPTPVSGSNLPSRPDSAVRPPEPTAPRPVAGGPTSGRMSGRIVPAVILIVLGIVFLIGNLTPLPFTGALLFLGLGTAFLLARLLTGVYGLAVPAGVLLGFGSYLALEEFPLLTTARGGWFFIMLGLGFLAVYMIGLRPQLIWPLFPAAVLTGFGVVLEGILEPALLAPLAPLAAYWPVWLIALGLWLIARDRLPSAIRQPLAVLGLIGLILSAVLVVAANAALPMSGAFWRNPGWMMPNITLGRSPVVGTVNLGAPLGATDTFIVNASAGRVTMRPSATGEVRVTATKHGWPSAPVVDVRLLPGNGNLTLEEVRTTVMPFGSGYADFDIEVPADRPIQLQTISGDVNLTDLAGPVTIATTSGDLLVNNLSGDLRLRTISGDISATNTARLREVSTVSGDVRLTGLFTQPATIGTTSGDIQLGLLPASSVRFQADTVSGSIRTGNLVLNDVRQERRSFSARFGAGEALITLRTVSGDMTFRAA